MNNKKSTGFYGCHVYFSFIFLRTKTAPSKLSFNTNCLQKFYTVSSCNKKLKNSIW